MVSLWTNTHSTERNNETSKRETQEDGQMDVVGLSSVRLLLRT